MKNIFIPVILSVILSACDENKPPLTQGDNLKCENNTVKCGDFCVDLNVDIYNCGACGHNCEKDLPNAKGVCNGNGSCLIKKCFDGWADCDGRDPPFDPYTTWEPDGGVIQSGQDNGCETKIIDPYKRCAK